MTKLVSVVGAAMTSAPTLIDLAIVAAVISVIGLPNAMLVATGMLLLLAATAIVASAIILTRFCIMLIAHRRSASPAQKD